MKIKTLLFSALALASAGLTAQAASVEVAMNNVSRTMTLTPKGSEDPIDVGTPASYVYTFEAAPGDYILTAYASNGTTVNGSMEITVEDSAETQQFKVLTCTAYANNKGWTAGSDYTFEVKVNTREGVTIVQTPGQSTTSGRLTFLALNGCSYSASFIPSEAHQAEGYVTLYRQGTLTANVNVYGSIPLSAPLSVTVPAAADFSLGIKFVHFADFTPVEPVSVTTDGGNKVYAYTLAQGQVYNYRTWMEGKLTQGGYFTMSADEAKRPQMAFSMADYEAYDPAQINHDVQSNQGYETGDIFVNINPQNFLQMNLGDTFKAHAMRTWELTDNSTNNYFIEPDFHYTVIDTDGKPCDSVIQVTQKPGSPWADIEAVGQGTVIVLVTYDAIGLNYYGSNGSKTPYMGGEFWGAIWPENTAAYVVSVGEGTSAVVPNMVVNEKYNSAGDDGKPLLKMAGKNVDNEFDVFYYLDDEEGFSYTFTPENVAEVTIAYPVIGQRAATYTGFGTEGVVKNADGSYTVLLKKGRQIVRLTDAAGKSVYQVMKALPCHREISNATRPGSQIFQPGDKIKIQYSGLFHPANKLAGIYNMSAYVTYNGIPNGSSLILGSGQYTFGSAASAQAVTVDVPADTEDSAISMTDGVIQVNGYGDPIGNHRTISAESGRSPNFTAIAHKTYFGALPAIEIPLSPVANFTIKVNCNVEDATIIVSKEGVALEPVDGVYTGTYGTYTVMAKKEGYKNFNHNFTIGDDAEGEQIFDVVMALIPENGWDGTTVREPAKSAEGAYQITSGYELAWFAAESNNTASDVCSASAILLNDIDLCGFDWTPIGGTSASTAFQGTFDGTGYTVTGLYINSTANYKGLFGYLYDATVKGLTVDGMVNGGQYVGGIAARLDGTTTVDRCVNHAAVSTNNKTCAGGITGYANKATVTISNCYNTGTVTASGQAAGICGGYSNARIENVYNIGEINCSNSNAGAVAGGTSAKTNISNAFCIKQYGQTANQTLVSVDLMASGEVAYKLGEAFGQAIGTDAYPVLGGVKVYYDETTGEYTNEMSGVEDITTEAVAQPAAYYNAQGVRFDRPQPGFNIVVYTDGTTSKLYVR